MKQFQSLYTMACAASIALGTLTATLVIPEQAEAQTIQISSQTNEIYAGMPFQLSVILSDFDEDPTPTIAPFFIPDADVQFVNVSPHVSSMVSIFNGKRTSKKEVKFIYTYQITPKKEGLYTIPIIKATQGSKSADSQQPVSFKASAVQTTQNMLLELVMPTQKIWVGQTFEVTLDWYLRQEVSNHTFNLPILNMPDTFDVEEPRESGRNRAVTLQVGTRQVNFPYTRDSVMKNRLEYTRFRISIDLTALKPGTITIPGSQVLAALESGTTPDFWGFGRAEYQLFKAEDLDRTITIQELPQINRPATYSNAMGDDYTIQVTADRTILKAGDPIILTIDISSPSSLEGLILPSLNDAGLNEQLFGVSNEDPIGETIDGAQNRNIRRFTVPVRVKSERVTEIPPLAFSYFNPKTEQYSTIHSQPIALSVSAVDKIGIGDVISNQKETPKQTPSPNNNHEDQPQDTISDPTAGALDLGLSSSPRDLSPSASHYNNRFLRLGIYAFPFLVWGLLIIIRRSKKSRSANAPQREAVAALKKALSEAQTKPAKEAASAIANALNTVITATESPREPFQAITERMDAEAYKPNAGNAPLSGELIQDIKKTVSEHIHPAYAKLISSLIILFSVCTFSINTNTAFAEESPVASAPTLANDVKHVGVVLDENTLLNQATDTYHQALETQERSVRIAQFKRASALFESLANAHPETASFQLDAGNAALGAVDFGRASLAYHRALAIDPNLPQAKANLAYIQSAIGDESASQTNLSSVFFLNKMITRETRLLIAAILFALGILLLLPWNPKTRRVTSFLAIIPLLAWVWMLIGAYIQPKSNDAIVMTESWLKTADNAGASNISNLPLEPGYSLSIVHTRDNWLQVETASGQKGWINRSSVAYIKPEK